MTTVNKKNHNACFLCLQTTAKNPSISLHRFPTNEYQRSLWLEACGLSEDDYKSSRRVCSLHFTEDSFNKHNVRKCLYPGAVPSIFFKNSEVPSAPPKSYRRTKSPGDNYKGHRKRKPRTTVKRNSRETSPFCPVTMVRYDTSSTDNKHPTKWVCRVCLAFLLTENAALKHFVMCKLPSKTHSKTDNSIEDDAAGPHEPTKPETILKYIERSSSCSLSSDSDT